MQFLERPVFSRPEHARQVELVHTLETMNDNLNPVGADAHVGIGLGDFFDWWQLGVEILRDLEEQHDTASLEPAQLLNSLLAVKNVFQGVVLHPRDKETGSRVPVLLLHHLPEVVQIVLVVDSESDSVVLVRAVLLVLKQVALHVLVFGVWDRKGSHEEGVKSNRNSLANCALERGLELAVEQVANNRFVTENVFVPGFFASNLIGLPLGLSLLDIRLLLFLVEILGHEVENCVDALLRIVLTVPFERHVVLAEYSLE